MVSLVILIIVMAVTMTLLFSMRAFAERQAIHLAPRQTARQAMDYLTHFVNAAADLNTAAGNPNALVAWYQIGDTQKQSTYNNLTSSQTSFGDEGTDIVTIAWANNPARMPINIKAGNPYGVTTGNTQQLLVSYRGGCGGAANDNAANLAAFKALTGGVNVGAGQHSALLTVVDTNGSWQYAEITAYTGSNCANPDDQVIDVTVKGPADATRYNPPGGPRTLVPPIYLIAGVEYVTFRVRTPNGSRIPVLEQKTTGVEGTTWYPGLFDATTDNPGTRFTPLVENVEDLQVSYLFATDTSAWYNSTSTALATAQGVPVQAQTPTGQVYDAANVSGLRITIIGRSTPLTLSSLKLTQTSGYGAGFRRPAAEDHAQGTLETSLTTGMYERYRMTNTLMFRNRMLGS